MKKILLILLLLPITLLSQNSWVKLDIQLDSWSMESSWVIYDDSGNIVYEMYDDYWDFPNELIQRYMTLPAGDYTFEFVDSYGDGFWPSGYVLLSNDCQDTLAYAHSLGNDTANGWTIPGVFGNSPAMLIESLTIAPCAPPVVVDYGCTDPVAANYDPNVDYLWIGYCEYIYGCTNNNAINFDPLATFDNDSCIFPAAQFSMSNAYQACNTNQTELTFEYQANGYGPTTDVNQIHYGYDISAAPFFQSQYYQGSVPVYGTPPTTFPYTVWECTYYANTLNQIVLKAGGNFMTEEIPHFFFVKFNDGNYSDTLWITPEACITGCIDSTSILYNPFANVDDGSCQTAITCPGAQTSINIIVTPDTYFGETSWVLEDTITETIIAQSPGYNQTGIAVTTPVCVDSTMALSFTVYDTYGDGMCGSCYGGVDGEILVVNPLCLDTLFYLTSPDMNFGYELQETFDSINFCAPPAPPSGCIDPGFMEYDPMAIVDDGSCLTPVTLGCLDTNAFNYDSLANQQLITPGCDYTLRLTDGVGDGWYGSYVGLLQDGIVYGPFTVSGGLSMDTVLSLSAMSPVKIFFFTQGNSVTTANQCGVQLISGEGVVTLDVGGTPWDPILSYPFSYITTLDCGNNCIEKIYGCEDTLAINYVDSVNTSDGSCYYNPGCNNPFYLEYDSLADYNDGSCLTPVVFGCTDSTAFNYNANANVDNGGCVPVIMGCMNPLAFNYNQNANTADACIPVISGCTSDIALNYDSLANTDDGSCIGVTYGCTDTTMWNYSPAANVDDGSCVAYVYGCMDATMYNYDPLANTENGSCVEYIYGCMDTAAFNYDPLVNTDNGTCIPIVLGCTNPIALNYCDSSNTDDFSCILPIYGCTDSIMFNYNPLANVDNNSCVPFIYGCTDPSMLNYNGLANTEDFSCIAFIYGCMDSTAFNYDSLANTDNESCITIVEGCMDQSAFNYNVTANVHDSVSCLYDANCITGPGTPYWLNDPCYAWVLEVDDYCCENEWDTICQATYDYCDGTWSGPLLTRVQTKKELIMITDLLGRPAKENKNELLFYIYSDGSTEKRVIKQ